MSCTLVAVTLRSALRHRANLAPASPAIVALRGRTLTYGAWNALAVEAERTLSALGVRPEDRLALVVPDPAACAAASVALGGSAALSIVDHAARADEFARQFADLGITAVVAQCGAGDDARAAAARAGIPVIELIRDPASGAGAFTLNAGERLASRTVPRSQAGDVAIVARTSGTTAAAKRIAVGHRPLVAQSAATARAFALDASDRCLFAQAPYHLAATATIGAIVLAGASIAFTQPVDAVALRAALDADAWTWLSLPPAACRELAHGGDMRGNDLRFVRTGSAPLAHDVRLRLETTLDAPVLQCYGMTEAGFIASTLLPPGERKRDSVGVARDCEIAIRGDDGRMLGAGQMGEIVVRGPNVFDGYGDPEADAHAFVEGWFRTGDLGRIDDGGHLFVLGRRKEVINRGGRTIFPADVEDALLADPAVAEAAAFAIPHATLGDEVAAAVVVRAGHARDEAALRASTAARLTLAATPKRFLFVDALPRTPNGKVRRAALQLLAAERAAAPARPETLLESSLVDAYRAVLGDARIGSDDDFFTAGGDSLRAMRLLDEIRALCGGEPSIELLFRAPTPRALAAHLAADVCPAASPLVRVQQGTRATPFFFLNGDLDGGGVYVRRFARALDPHRTIVGVFPHGTNGVAALPDIGAMADAYVDVIERERPHGAVLLGGYCNGGIVAYEIARRLRARGRDVGPLVLVAAAASNAPFRGLRRAVRAGAHLLARSEADELRAFRTLRAHALAAARAARTGPHALVARAVEIVRRALLRRADVAAAEPARSAAYRQMSDALTRYDPHPYDGPVHLFWAMDDAPPLPADPTHGWGGVAPALVVHRVPGDHFGVVTREAEALAAAIAPLLAAYG